MVSQVIQEVGKSIVDLDLETRVRAALAIRLGPTLRRLSVDARSGCVTLRGQVVTYYEKQLGSASARRVAGVRTLIDAIDVIQSPHASA